MSFSAWATSLGLLLALAITVLSCIGLAFARDFFNRLHYLAPVTSVGITFLLAAVLASEVAVTHQLRINHRAIVGSASIRVDSLQHRV